MTITYSQLLSQVCRCANVLKQMGEFPLHLFAVCSLQAIQCPTSVTFIIKIALSLVYCFILASVYFEAIDPISWHGMTQRWHCHLDRNQNATSYVQSCRMSNILDQLHLLKLILKQLSFCPWSRCEEGRQGVYLPSHDPRAGLHYAGLCQDRCRSLYRGESLVWCLTFDRIRIRFTALFGFQYSKELLRYFKANTGKASLFTVYSTFHPKGNSVCFT